MSRRKCHRQTSYQPLCTRFAPEEPTHNDAISLLTEESEALYLIDLMGYYQEDAAQKMQVSRSTFARIIKSARYKVALALLGGHHLTLETTRERYTVALCSESLNEFSHLHPKAFYIIIATVAKGAFESWIEYENPVVTEGLKPSNTLSDIFQKHGVNFFITSNLGRGLQSILLSKGIHVISKKQMTKEGLLNLFSEPF
jgi:predicted DNA-binding protein (UPF0251 family)/predicted Fe-Mo cluster-binding NifX family protein